jgi:hypothetical protein
MYCRKYKDRVGLETNAEITIHVKTTDITHRNVLRYIISSKSGGYKEENNEN